MPVDAESEEAKMRKTWMERFLKMGGFDQLLKLLEKALNATKDFVESEDISGESVSTNKKFLNQMLKIIKIFVNAAIQAFYSAEQAETIHLLRKHSSVREDK